MIEIIIATMHYTFMTFQQLLGAKWSCIYKFNIVNHFCIATIIGQVKLWGIFRKENSTLHETYQVSIIIMA